MLDDRFISFTKDIVAFLRKIKRNFDEFDRLNTEKNKQIDFTKENKKEIFRKLDISFEKVWRIVKGFVKDRYVVHQKYFYKELNPLLGTEINTYIYQKPLGYPGDYIIMNYIYDYHGNAAYLGNSSYEKLINNYTCNIPVACSNIKRKEFIKEKIIGILERREKAKVSSIACGSARELIELLREGRITKSLIFKCLDFENRALDYMKNQINKIEKGKKNYLSIEYIYRDIIDIITTRGLKEKLNNSDLIYAFGIFDYLTDKMASRLIKELYRLLRKGGELIVTNASLENSSHRAYYELLGDWRMIYRSKKEMLSWVKDTNDNAEIKFERISDFTSYLFLSIKRKDKILKSR